MSTVSESRNDPTNKPPGEDSRGGPQSAARARLSQYYGLDSDRSSAERTPDPNNQGGQVQREGGIVSTARKVSQHNPLDINSQGFDPDMFVTKLIKEASLSQLMAQEGEIVRQIQGLDSDMQTLVYENYNKFIAATETIRKMRVDFKSMEEEMDQLAESMSSITKFSSQISDKLRGRRMDVARLSSTHSTLQKLQFVLELPNRLNECIQEDQLARAVDYWIRANAALKRYRDMPSFAGIQEDCEKIVADLKAKLELRLKDPNCEGEQLSEAVQLLQQLGTPTDSLYQSYLAHCTTKLTIQLQQLQQQVNLAQLSSQGKLGVDSPPVMDVLEFIDLGCNKFLAELQLSISSFTETFSKHGQNSSLDQEALDTLRIWTGGHVTSYLDVIQSRLILENPANSIRFAPNQNSEDYESEECVLVVVRAIDRFHRRLATAGRIIALGNIPVGDEGVDLQRAGLDVVLAVCQSFCTKVSAKLEQQLEENLISARQQIATPRRSTGDSSPHSLSLAELANSLLTSIADSLKAAFNLLLKFLDPELSFSGKTYFRLKYSQEMVVRNVLMKHFWFIKDLSQRFTGEVSVPPGLLLLLSRSCLDLHISTTHYLTNIYIEQFPTSSDCSIELTQVNSALDKTAHSLLDRYVQVQSGELSLMLRKSVEARDWLSTVEPRSVRAVMKRVVEDVTVIDAQVGELFEEGQKKARSSDSSRRTAAVRSRSAAYSAASTYTGNQLRSLDSSSLATNIQKLFSDKIDYFTEVKPAKVSILTSIIKLGLKTLLECVRLKTFARYGLQQMQVDSHYLQLYLWRFVEDENIVHHLLDEIMSSALQRSLEQPPHLMEPSVVEVICDKV